MDIDFDNPMEELSTTVIRLLPIVSSISPSSSYTETPSEQLEKCLPEIYENTQKVPECKVPGKTTDDFFKTTVPRSDFCSKELGTRSQYNYSEAITIRAEGGMEHLEIECHDMSDLMNIRGWRFRQLLKSPESKEIFIKNWSKAGSIKVKLAPHSSSSSFLDLGVLSHPSAEQRTSLDVTIPTVVPISSENTLEINCAIQFFYSEAENDEQKLFTLPLAISFLPNSANSYLAERSFDAGKSRPEGVAIEVELYSEEEYRFMVEMITPEMRIIISKMTFREWPTNFEILKKLPQFTIKVAHLDVRRCEFDAYLFAAFLENFSSIDEISCHVVIKDKEELFKLVAVINQRNIYRVSISILQLNLEAFTDLETETFDLWHNLNWQIDELHLNLSFTDITSLTVVLTKLPDFTTLKLSIKTFLTNSELLPLPVFSIQRVVPLSKYVDLKNIEFSNFANPILMDDFLALPACKEIKLKNVVLEFSSLEKLQQFSNLEGKLLLKRFTVKVDGKKGKNELILLIAMTNKKQNVKRIANQIDKTIACFECESLHFSYMEKKARLGGVITAFCCESLVQFCCEWNVDPYLKLDFSNLKFQCLTPYCSKCSDLMIFLVLENSDRYSLAETLFNSYKRPQLSISNLSWLSNQLSHHPRAKNSRIQVCHIKQLTIFIKRHEPRSSITEILIPSLNCLRRLGIEVEELKLLVDQDDSGWSFIRLCSTEFNVIIEFKNGFEVQLPPHATESMITIECFAIPRKAKATTLEGESLFPIISVDQLGTSSCAKSISVLSPIASGIKGLHCVIINGPRIIYPTSISERGKLNYIADKILPSNIAEKWRDAFNSPEFHFNNCAYVCVHPDEADSELIHFDCLRAFGQNKLGQSKFLPFCEIKKIDLVTDEKVSLEIRGNIRFFGNGDVSQVDVLNLSSQKEFQTFRTKLIDPSMEPKCTITCRVNGSCSESGSFDFQSSGVKLVNSTPEIQELLASDAQARKSPLSLLTIYLGQLNATEFEISQNKLLCKVDLLDVSIVKTSCDALNVLSGKIQSLSRLNLSVENIVDAGTEVSIVPFNNLLKPSVLSPNLKFVKLSCPRNVLHIENLFQILIDSSNTHNISELHFSRVQLAWSSRSKIEHFCENLERYSAIRPNFVFFIDNCEAIIKNFYTNVNLDLLMSLTLETECLTEKMKVVEPKNFQLNNQEGKKCIEKLRLEFKQSVLSTIDIAGVISASTIEDVTMLCKVWRVTSETIHCQNLLFKCGKNATHSDLLSLCFALSNTNAIGGDDLDRLFSQNCFSMTSLSYLNKFLISADILSNPRENEVVATNLKVVIESHESRCEFFRLQTQTASTLKKIGISFQSVLVSVESDDTNWAYVKIALTPEKHRIQFSNEVTVTFPTNCTKEPRTVSIEVHPIPDEVIKRVCAWHGTEATCHVSPIVFIDQEEDTPFLEDVYVQVPYSSSDPNVCGEKLFTEAFSKRCYEQVWSLVTKENLQKSWYTLTYNSKHVSPLSVISSALQKVFRTSDFSNAYFPNCVYVTVQTLDHKSRNVKFDCIKVQNEKEWKNLKVMTQLECRKIGLMNRDDIILAELTPNLCIDGFFHPEEANERLRFFCPENIHNEQEYVMKKVISEHEPQGRVIYYQDRAGVETRLPHIMYVVSNLKATNVNPVLNVLRDVGCGPEDPEMNQDGDPEENLERPLEANPPVPANEPHLDEPEVDQVENNAEPNLDPERNWVIGPQLNPNKAMGPEIDPRRLFGPGIDADGFIRSDGLQEE